MRVMRVAPALVLVVATLASAEQAPPAPAVPPPGTPGATNQQPAPTADAAAQPAQPVFRAGVDLIEIDVSVIDSRGRPITDMLGPEFTVTIDGQPRKVMTAQFVELRASRDTVRNARAPAPDPLFSSNAEAARGRLILLAVDRESISFGEGRHTLRAAGRFLDTLGPTDRVGLITLPLPGPSVDFTANHQLVRKTAERVTGLAHRPKGLLNMGVVEAYAIDQHNNPQLEAAVLNRFCGQFPAGSNAEQVCELEVRSEAAGIVGQVKFQVEGALRTLQSVLEALRDVEGPKSLVWISEGLPLDGVGSELSIIARLAAASRTTIHVIMLDAPLIDMSEREQSPTHREDRDMQVRGLEMLAGYTRGALFRVSANPEAVFQRLEEELSGHYLLGVESTERDTDGRRHDIKVSVRRRGAEVRARREFVMTDGRKAAGETVETRVQRLLRSPFTANELPLRLSTYAYRDPASARVRVLVATEIEAAAAKEAGNVALAYALVDPDGKITGGTLQREKLAPVAGPRGPVFEHLGVLSVDPGSYTLRLAAIDAEGRRGSIDHPLHAWEMSNVPFAVGDLIVADPPAANQSLRPVVEARVSSGRLAAYLELYGDSTTALGETRVRVEVAADENGAALAAGDGVLSTSGDPRSRTVSATVPIAALPPGRYMARAIVTRGSQKVGQLTRPFVVSAAPPDAALSGTSAFSSVAGRAPLAAMLQAPAAFRRDDLLTPDVMGFFLDALDQKNPAIKTLTAQVRTGSFAGAARLAFDAGDQVAAMFMRGLELLAANDVNKAAPQFDGAIRSTPDFAPAAFYLGVCFATAGRDRDAVAWWRRALAGPRKSPMQYAALGDALVRLGDLDQAAATLAEGLAALPADDEIRRRLAFAQARGSKHAEALATIDPYLAKHATDQEALLVGLHAIYTTHLDGKAASPDRDRDRARMRAWSRQYAAVRGPHAALVSAWVTFVEAGGKF